MCDKDNFFFALYEHTEFDNEEINTNKMIRALSAIALEMQTFHGGRPISPIGYQDTQELSEKLSICKSNLRLKRKQIRMLNQNLRKACIVAKTVVSAKEKKETPPLRNNITSARSGCIDLYHKNINTKTETINNLITTNQALQQKINDMDDFVQHGYLELQKMRNKGIERLPTVMKLKEIIISCGQYYANYVNEHETRLQLEQKNRFLNNKMKILINNLEAMTEELKNLRHHNNRLVKENAVVKNKNMKRTESNSEEMTKCANSLIPVNDVPVNQIDTGVIEGDHLTFDLTLHLSLVKQLLKSQDYMLKDLKKLSEELMIEPNLSPNTK